MVTMTSYRHHGVSITQVVARRQVKMHLRKIREREYSKLRALVPSVASRKQVTKVEVIEEAVRYIEELHAALMDRFRQKHGNMADDKAQETVEIFVSRMMGKTSNSSHPNSHNDSSHPNSHNDSSHPNSHNNSAHPLNVHSVDSVEKQNSPSSFLLWRTKHLDNE